MKKSYIIAAIMILGISRLDARVATCFNRPFPTTVAATNPQKNATAEPMTVQVRPAKVEAVQRHIIAQGHAEPNRTVTVRAETSGQVEEILARMKAPKWRRAMSSRGSKIKDREALLERAKARVREQENAYQASQALGKKGYQTQRRSDEAYSALQTARAEMEEARICARKHGTIRAPFGGVVLTSSVELGTYVGVNGEVAMIVDNDPLGDQRQNSSTRHFECEGRASPLRSRLQRVKSATGRSALCRGARRRGYTDVSASKSRSTIRTVRYRPGSAPKQKFRPDQSWRNSCRQLLFRSMRRVCSG